MNREEQLANANKELLEEFQKQKDRITELEIQLGTYRKKDSIKFFDGMEELIKLEDYLKGNTAIRLETCIECQKETHKLIQNMQEINAKQKKEIEELQNELGKNKFEKGQKIFFIDEDTTIGKYVEKGIVWEKKKNGEYVVDTYFANHNEVEFLLKENEIFATKEECEKAIIGEKK